MTADSLQLSSFAAAGLHEVHHLFQRSGDLYTRQETNRCGRYVQVETFMTADSLQLLSCAAAELPEARRLFQRHGDLYTRQETNRDSRHK